MTSLAVESWVLRTPVKFWGTSFKFWLHTWKVTAFRSFQLNLKKISLPSKTEKVNIAITFSTFESVLASNFGLNKQFWLCVLIMLHTCFRVNLHSVVPWMSRNSMLETETILTFEWPQRSSNSQLAILVKWLKVCSLTTWLWVRMPLYSLKQS